MGRSKQVNAGQDPATPWVIDSYARLSWKPDTRDLEKIEDQFGSNRDLIGRVGGVLGKELSDGASAWKRGSRRPGWDALLERLRSGASQGVVVWNTDRLLRSPWDLETLIDLGDKGYRVLSVTGEYDLSNADHRFILRIKTAQAAKESDDKSRRVRERLKGLRQRGVVAGGPRRFGFPGKDPLWKPAEDQPESDRPMVDAALVVRERRAIQEAAEALLSGGSLSQVARDWNDAGLRTAAGREWIAITVRETMKRPTLAGRIEHDGKLEGRLPGESILDEATFGQLRALFAGRRRGGQVGLKYLASGIVRCGECYQPLHGRTNGTRANGTARHNYFCNVSSRGCGKIYADMEAVDDQLRSFAPRRLSDKKYASSINAARLRVAGRHAEIAEEIKKVKKLQIDIAARLGREEMEPEAFAVATEVISTTFTRARRVRIA
jgi:site-specific DNA recombinase